jgi:hypothetical protein
MTIRTRKLIGTVGLLALVSVWGLFAMALAQSVLTNINGFVAAIFYVVAGLGWVLPAMPLIAWMSRPDTPRA